MKKVITLSIVSLVSAFILTGCMGSSTAPSAHDNDAKHENRVYIDKNLKLESIRYAIKNTGKRFGWIMTDFKSNSIIAEKISSNENKTVTVTYDKSSFELSPDDEDLKEAILHALENPAKRR